MSSSKFHLSLDVADLRSAVAFLELLFGQPPARSHDDYAKFELDEPPLVLSLVPGASAGGTGLNHLGFRLPDRPTLDALEQRLAAASVPFQREESVACCHSRQTKFWVRDPAAQLWEFYVLEEENSAPAPAVFVAPPTIQSSALPRNAPERRRWLHRLGSKSAAQIDAADASLDEVVLEGSINARPEDLAFDQLAGEAARVLRPGGQLLVHGLTADRPLEEPPRLPGPASVVEHVPTLDEVLHATEAAGFVGIELLTFGETYCFEHAGATLRETRLRAWQPAPPGAPHDFTVIYRGPFAELYDEAGQVYRRGEPAPVDEVTWRRLQATGMAQQFVVIATDQGVIAR